MDVRAKRWMRSWVLGASAVGWIGPGMLAAQTVQPAPQSTAQPALLPPTPNAVRMATHEAEPNGAQVAESEVEARLRELYERDGREMPNMAVAPAAQPGGQRTAQASQPRYSSAPPAPPAAKPQNRVTGFFKKLLPGGNKQPPAQDAAPAARPTVRPQQSAAQPMPVAAQPQRIQQSRPAPQYQPPQHQPVPQPYQQQYQPVQPMPPNNYRQFHPQAGGSPAPAARAVAVPAQPAPPVRPAPSARPAAPIPQPAPAPQAEIPQQEELVELPDLDAEEAAAPQMGEPEMTLEPDEFDAEEPEITPQSGATRPAFDEEFPDPFAGASEEEPSSGEDDMVEQNPYTGEMLEPLEAEPPTPAPSIAPQARVDEAAVDESTATKMRRIIQRTDMKGLKGFCPVTLRDQRELADSRPEFVATYRGQKFYCASKVAQAKFEADPARYAPAAYGADVVVLTDDQDVAEGTLDYAAWYKGRLYLFSNQQTHDTFVANPERYASPPGIE